MGIARRSSIFLSVMSVMTVFALSAHAEEPKGPPGKPGEGQKGQMQKGQMQKGPVQAARPGPGTSARSGARPRSAGCALCARPDAGP